jgi:cytochrome P450
VRFKRWTDDISAISPAITDPARIEEIRATVREMDSYFREVIEARRRHPRADIISGLINPRGTGAPLTDDELIAFLFLLLVAGLETTMYFLANILRAMIDMPQYVERLAADRTRIPDFVEEVLRFDSPGHGTFRITTQEVVVGETTIPAGQVVLLLMASSNRDERKLVDAELFDMNRRYEKPLAFGYGIHFCLGAPLARLEARVACETLLSRFERFDRIPGEIAWNQSMTVRGPVSLPVDFIRRV